MTFTEYAPERLFQNGNVVSLFKVLDGVKEFKEEQLLLLQNMLNFYVNKNPTYVNKFLWSVGQLRVLTDMPVFLQERLILKAFDLFGMKGSLAGLNLFATVFADGTITVDLSKFKSPAYLQPGDLEFGRLPNGADFVTAATDPTNFNFVFAGSFAYYYPTISMVLKSNYVENPNTRRDIMVLLPEFIPMCTPGSCNVIVEFRRNDNTLLEILNY